MKPKYMTELPNDGKPVLLMRRVNKQAVKALVGYRAPDLTIHGWFGAKPPTHWCELPEYGGTTLLPPLNHGQCSVCRATQWGSHHEHPCE